MPDTAKQHEEELRSLWPLSVLHLHIELTWILRLVAIWPSFNRLGATQRKRYSALGGTKERKLWKLPSELSWQPLTHVTRQTWTHGAECKLSPDRVSPWHLPLDGSRLAHALRRNHGRAPQIADTVACGRRNEGLRILQTVQKRRELGPVVWNRSVRLRSKLVNRCTRPVAWLETFLGSFYIAIDLLLLV